MISKTLFFSWLVLFSVSPSFATNEATPDSSCETFLRSDTRQSLREQFVEKYASKIYASEQENLEWILNIKNLASPPRFYAVVKNSALKALNDTIIRDKDLVTALTNYHKELFLKEINAHFPIDSYRLYSDFKSVRLEVLGEPSNENFALVEDLFEQANKNFYTDPALHQILRSEDLQQRGWFTLGIGDLEGEAGLAARGAKNHSSPAVRFENSNFQERMLQKIAQFQSLHSSLMESLMNSDMVEPSPLRFKLDVFLHCRKAKDSLHLLELLKDEYSRTASLTPFLTQKILTYCSIADEFSPSLLIAKREVLTIEKTPHGVIALDFIGLGAENLKATAESLLDSTDIRDVLSKSREGEKRVTESFMARKIKVKEVIENYFSGAVSVRFSGDDGIIIPEHQFDLEDQLELLDRLSRILPYPFFRMSTVHTREPQPALSAQMISQAESIEKTLRPLLRKKLGAQVAKKIHINILHTEEPETNKVFLVLKTGVDLSPEQTEVLYDIFEQSVQSAERDLRMHGENLTIETAKVLSAAG